MTIQMYFRGGHQLVMDDPKGFLTFISWFKECKLPSFVLETTTGVIWVHREAIDYFEIKETPK